MVPEHINNSLLKIVKIKQNMIILKNLLLLFIFNIDLLEIIYSTRH